MKEPAPLAFHTKPLACQQQHSSSGDAAEQACAGAEQACAFANKLTPQVLIAPTGTGKGLQTFEHLTLSFVPP